MENTSRPTNPFKVSLYVVLAILLVSAGYAIYYFNGLHKAVNASDQAANENVFLAVADSSVLGNYTVKIESPKDTSRLNGFIEKDSLGTYVLHILSEYEPRIIALQASDSTLFNDEIGEARISYRPNSEKTTIKFEKEGFVCTLVK